MCESVLCKNKPNAIDRAAVCRYRSRPAELLATASDAQQKHPAWHFLQMERVQERKHILEEMADFLTPLAR